MVELRSPSPTYQSNPMDNRPHYEPQQPREEFPQELPPRPPSLYHRSGFRQCMTFKFLRSYSLRHLPNTRTRLRRIAMIVTLLFGVGMIIVDLLFGFFWLGALIAFCVLDFIFSWLLAWYLAVIGDAVGTRRVCGVTIGRNFFDAYIFALALLYTMFFLLAWFVIGGVAFEIAWIGLNLLTLAVAWIASEPPYSGNPRYGSQVV